MADRLARLDGHALIGLDTCVLIYHLESHPTYVPVTRALFEGVAGGRWHAVTSTLTLMELTVRPWQLGQATAARQYEALLANFPQLSLVDITRDVARRAAQLRALYHLQPADALQVGAALVHGATAFVTNDRVLARLTPAIQVLLLDDL